MKSKKLTCVKVVHDSLERVKGVRFFKRQLLFETDCGAYIVASAVKTGDYIFETYLFDADENGKIIDFTELEGSQRGTNDIYQVLRDAGYTIEGGQE